MLGLELKHTEVLTMQSMASSELVLLVAVAGARAIMAESAEIREVSEFLPDPADAGDGS